MKKIQLALAIAIFFTTPWTFVSAQPQTAPTKTEAGPSALPNEKNREVQRDVEWLRNNSRNLREQIETIQKQNVDIYSSFWHQFAILLSVAITIVGLGSALVGTFIYKFVSSRVKKTIRNEMDDNRRRALAGIYEHISNLHWRQYQNEEFIKFKMKPKTRRNARVTELERHLEMSISASELAYDNAAALSSSTNKAEKKHYRALLEMSINNLAFHISIRQRSEDRKRAIDMAEKIESFDSFRYPGWYAAKNRLEWASFQDTCAWIYVTCGENENTRKRGLELLLRLRAHHDLPDIARTNLTKFGWLEKLEEFKWLKEK